MTLITETNSFNHETKHDSFNIWWWRTCHQLQNHDLFKFYHHSFNTWGGIIFKSITPLTTSWEINQDGNSDITSKQWPVSSWTMIPWIYVDHLQNNDLSQNTNPFIHDDYNYRQQLRSVNDNSCPIWNWYNIRSTRDQHWTNLNYTRNVYSHENKTPQSIMLYCNCRRPQMQSPFHST